MKQGIEQRRFLALRFIEQGFSPDDADRRFMLRRWLLGLAPYFVLEAVLDLMCEFADAQ